MRLMFFHDRFDLFLIRVLTSNSSSNICVKAIRGHAAFDPQEMLQFGQTREAHFLHRQLFAYKLSTEDLILILKPNWSSS